MYMRLVACLAPRVSDGTVVKKESKSKSRAEFTCQNHPPGRKITQRLPRELSSRSQSTRQSRNCRDCSDVRRGFACLVCGETREKKAISMRRQSQRKFVTKGFALNSFRCEPSFSFSIRGVDPFGSVTCRIYFRPKKFLRCSSSSLRCFLQFFTSISSIYQPITCTKSLLNHARFKNPRPLTLAFVRLHAVKKKDCFIREESQSTRVETRRRRTR